MNTEDKLYSNGGKEMDPYIDVFTDHYVVPRGCYGPMIARARGKKSMETETWFVGTEYQLPQAAAQFLASGQNSVSPWHPRVLFEKVPGGNDDVIIPSPVVAATAAFNYFVTGRPFERIVFKDHLPWVFQFGKDEDPKALLVVFGQMVSIGSTDVRDRLWHQVDGSPGGVMTIDNSDGLLQFYDLSGNPCYVGEKTVKLPMSILPLLHHLCERPQGRRRASGTRADHREASGRNFAAGFQNAAFRQGRGLVGGCSQLPQSHDQGQTYGKVTLGDYACVQRTGGRARCW